MEVTLSFEQCDDPPPDCPMCAERTRQEFRPIAIASSTSVRAHDIAADIAANDYHVADMQREHRYEGTPKVRYKDQTAPAAKSAWGGVPPGALEAAVAAGREMRLQFGSGLDVLQTNIRNGTEPDLIANSKKLCTRVW
jgi:hypothetical protein